MGIQLTTLSSLTSISIAFIADYTSNILYYSSEDGQNWSTGSLVTGESSCQVPSLCAFKGKLWIAFTADNSSLDILICSSDDGQNWSPNTWVEGQFSLYPPSLCVFQGKLWVAFIAYNSSNDILVCSSDDGQNWSPNSWISGESSSQAPSLCVFQDKLWIAFIANNSSGDILVCSSDDGQNWSPNSWISGESSSHAPSLCVFQDKLWIAFIANNSSNDILVCWSGDGQNWSSNAWVSQSSSLAPSLTATPDQIYLGLIGDNSSQILVCTSSDGTSWSASQVVGQPSGTSPALFAQQSQTGTLRPKYQVMTIVYAPPGSAAAATESSVTYAQSSSAGTTSSISQAIQTGRTVTVAAGEGIPGAGFAATQTETDTSTIDILKTQSQTILVSGPTTDGIDHDYDQFWLLLNPLYTITSDTSNNVAWSMGVDGNSMELVYVYAAQLKDPSTLAAGVQAALSAAGMTLDDYQQILSLNPFAAGSTSIDTKRYVPTGLTLPYQPPLAAGDPVPVVSYTQQNTINTSQTTATEVQYEVDVTMTAGLEGVFSLETTTSMQWTSTNTAGINNSGLQSASLSLGGPSFGYSGPIEVNVYWDTVFNTFMFAFAE